MAQDSSEYRQIFKATSLFGGVQFINILLAVVRSKFVAILLGPSGMGIAGLFLSATTLISGITAFGLGTSAIRDISIANDSKDQTQVSRVIKIFQKLVWITGFLGLAVTLIFAKQISILTFDSEKYTSAFRWLSISLLFSQLTSGQNVLMQGTRQLKSLAYANVLGSLGSLLISLPLYYFYQYDGIVPAIIAGSALAMFIEYFYSSKIKTEKVTPTKTETLTVAKSMLTLGLVLSISGIITVASSFYLRTYIGKNGSLGDVGLYNAGFNIINSYVGLIFTAMSTDFFPRLSAVAFDKDKIAKTVNQQADISILILGPVLTGFIVFINWVIIILYDSRFLEINDMLKWAALGVFFKAASWAVMFIFLAKKSNKLYFWNELTMNIYLTGFSILFYSWWGLEGLGIAFLLSYFMYFIQAYICGFWIYNFRFAGNFIKIFSVQLVIAVLSFVITIYSGSWQGYVFGSLLFGISICLSIYGLEKRVHFISSIRNKILGK